MHSKLLIALLAGASLAGTGVAVADDKAKHEAGASGQAGVHMQTQFEDLDRDGDGYLSRSEIETEQDLNASWPDLDADGDGRLDRAEFARFETQEMQGEGSQEETPSGQPADPVEKPEVEKN